MFEVKLIKYLVKIKRHKNIFINLKNNNFKWISEDKKYELLS